MVVYLGTTGWDYDFWTNSFYPEHATGSKLQYYSEVAGFTELQSTYNRIPEEAKVQYWYQNSPDDFIFVVRMLREVTYNSDMEINEERIIEFLDAFELLDDKFEMLLLHYPMQFQKGNDSFEYLINMVEFINGKFDGHILVEAPNRSWQKIEVKEKLHERSACLVGNDRRPIPSLMRDPDLYYLRLLGDKRTVPKSKFGENPLDRDDDLKYWAEHLQFLDDNHDALFVTFDNHFSGNAAEDAFTMSEELNRLGVKTVGFDKNKR